jgi:hypothetical protein
LGSMPVSYRDDFRTLFHLLDFGCSAAVECGRSGMTPWRCIKSVTFWHSNHFNFTRAADACNVTQPSLTRAIKQLEQEFGGELFRRERPNVRLSDLGQIIIPHLQQVYDEPMLPVALQRRLTRTARSSCGLE